MEDVMDEKDIDVFIAQGRKAEAIKLLFKLIVKYSREKNFIKAESLRDRIFEVDPMALNAIIKSAEIIESEKNESIDQNHMDVWADFYKTLTTGESNILYFAMKQMDAGPDEIVFKQGQKNTKLYFIDQGQLKLFYGNQGVERLIRTLGSGSIAGEDTFFTITVCTTSLYAISRAKVRYLTQEDYQKWQREMPTLASKVQEYCSKLVKSHDILKKKGINRREYPRHKLVSSILFQVLNASGKPIGKAFKGDLADISLGGLSFLIKTSNKQNALMLLGRKLRVKFNLPLGVPPVEIIQSGMITGVISHPFSDYSIHMKFDTMMSRVYMDELANVPEFERTVGSGKVDRTAY